MSAFNQSDNIDLFSIALLTKKVHVNIEYIGSNIKHTLEKMIASNIEGKCIVEGFVINGSVKLITYSSGLVQGAYVAFDTVFECSICSPVEGMLINCVVKNITKAGIQAELRMSPSPLVIYVTRDHHYTTSYFSEVKEHNDIVVKVIGQRYELNDTFISIISELVPKQIVNKTKTIKKKLKLKPAAQAEQVQAEQVQAEQVQAEQVQAEQVQTEQVQAEQVQAEKVQAEQVQTEQAQPEADEIQIKLKPKKKPAGLKKKLLILDN